MDSTVAIALSGGGAKGDFELGALAFLYEQGVRPGILTSTSVGSINAIKLAEDEDAADHNRGLQGLSRIWNSLKQNNNMYEPESWLDDPDMAEEVRELITRRRTGLGITAPDPGTWGVLDWAADLSFLVGDGARLLKSLAVISRPDVRAIFNLNPIVKLLHTKVDMDLITQWAAQGGKLRIAAVGLESGALRYITESGAMIERDGSPVLRPGPLSQECQLRKDLVASLEATVVELQRQLSNATPSQKSDLVEQILDVRGQLIHARADFDSCSKSTQDVPLTVDLLDGVLASASIPGIFPPVLLGDESYIDGGAREILPIQVAIDAGATEIYAISASPIEPEVRTRGSYRHAGIFEITSRAVMEIILGEVAHDDVRPTSEPVKLHVIAPRTPNNESIHDLLTVDPGLVRISIDYGYMCAADTVLSPDEETRKHLLDLAWKISWRRRENWVLENQLNGEPDPRYPGSGPFAPVPSAQQRLDSGRADLSNLVDERRAAGGRMPEWIDHWLTNNELHPWDNNPPRPAEPAECAGVRESISNLKKQIAELRASISKLPTSQKVAVEEQIEALQEKANELAGQLVQLGCSS